MSYGHSEKLAARGSRSFRRRLALVTAAGATVAAATTLFATAASAQPAPRSTVASPAAGTSKVVVKVDAKRGNYARVLVTTKGVGLTLYEYTDTKVPCTGSCLAVWPPLYMPKGATVPAGVKGLGTVTLANGKLQVTYDKKPLYTYYDDGGNSTSGAGIKHWVVAELKTSTT
jgi:predicted lipoprotein with Yx(FWY)xxD motif